MGWERGLWVTRSVCGVGEGSLGVGEGFVGYERCLWGVRGAHSVEEQPAGHD